MVVVIVVVIIVIIAGYDVAAHVVQYTSRTSLILYTLNYDSERGEGRLRRTQTKVKST